MRWAGLGLVLMGALFWLELARAQTQAPATPQAHANLGTAPAPRLERVERPKRPAEPQLNWSQLSPSERQALQPLETQWSSIDGAQQRKWRIIAHRYQRASPVEQARMHERMQAWVLLTPEQRRVARENYEAMRRVAPATRAQRWSSYEQLPPEQRIEMHTRVEQQRKKAHHPVKRLPAATQPPPVAAASKPSAPVAPMLEPQRPRILPPSGMLDRNTLLPAPLPTATPVPASPGAPRRD